MYIKLKARNCEYITAYLLYFPLCTDILNSYYRDGQVRAIENVPIHPK